MTKLGADEIVLYATNTGSLYEAHKRMAREGAKLDTWKAHVTGRVLTLYGREVEPAWAPLRTRIAAATELKAYYERHLREMEG